MRSLQPFEGPNDLMAPVFYVGGLSTAVFGLFVLFLRLVETLVNR